MGVMHVCNYPGCNKQFDRKYNLKCHLRIHSNEKPYRCHHENCSRSFRWKSSLNHHLMSLDHTPVAVRRERKARAAKRRQAQLALAKQYATSKHLQDGTSPGADRILRPPNSTPLANSRLWQARTTVHSFHTMPLEPPRNVDCVDTSMPNDFNAQHNVGARAIAGVEAPHQVSGPYEHRTIVSGAGVQHPNPLPLQSHPPFERGQPQIHRPQVPLWDPNPAPAGRVMHDRSLLRPQRPPLGLPDRGIASHAGEALRPRDIASIDSALESTLEPLTPLHGLAKEGIEHISLPTKTSHRAELPPPMVSADPKRDPLQAKSLGPNGQKPPLLSIFEDSSPASLLNAIPPALDPLFPSYNFDSTSTQLVQTLPG